MSLLLRGQRLVQCCNSKLEEAPPEMAPPEMAKKVEMLRLLLPSLSTVKVRAIKR